MADHDDPEVSRHRFERGDWAFDPAVDPSWDNPEIERFRLEDADYELIADAALRNQVLTINGRQIVDESGKIQYCILDLRRLLETIKVHPEAKLGSYTIDGRGEAVAGTVYGYDGEIVAGDPTLISLSGCVISGCYFSSVDIPVSLDIRSRFIEQPVFKKSIFCSSVKFKETLFPHATTFRGAKFLGGVSFKGSRFRNHISFQATRFGRGANFSEIVFVGKVWFSNTTFLGDVFFSKTSFRAYADFQNSKFLGSLNFSESSFLDGLSLSRSDCSSSVLLSGALLGKECIANFTHVNILGSMLLSRSRVSGRIDLSESSVGGHLDFRGAEFGLSGRVRFGKIFFSSDSLIHFDPSMIRGRWFQSVGHLNSYLSAPESFRFWVYCLRNWVGQCRHRAFVYGDSSRSPALLRHAAADYDLLASYFRRQPGFDWEEDECRWRAHELRRLAKWSVLFEDFKEFMASGTPHVPSLKLVFQYFQMAFEYFWIVGHSVLCWFRFAWRMLWQALAGWLISRTVVGYLLQPLRILISGGLIILLCAVLYAIYASDSTMVMNAGETTIPPWKDGVWSRLRYGLYFSLTTFVTLGYGDMAPTGWFKLLTGVQALAGVTLLALFTVAWGRKLVR